MGFKIVDRQGMVCDLDTYKFVPVTRPIRSILTHCTATDEKSDIGVKEVRAWHLKEGWSDIGYHFLIRLDGTIEIGRDLNKVGAHVKDFNTNSVGTVYAGGLRKGKASDTRTPTQKSALHALHAKLKNAFPPINEIAGHRDKSPDRNKNGIIERFEWIKECPCYDAIPEYAYLLKRAA